MRDKLFLVSVLLGCGTYLAGIWTCIGWGVARFWDFIPPDAASAGLIAAGLDMVVIGLGLMTTSILLGFRLVGKSDRKTQQEKPL